MLPVIILAGGLATRLRPITEVIPKALIPISGKPFIFHQLEYLKSQGIQNVVISIGYLGDQIQNTVGDGRLFGLEIKYSQDGDVLLGTGGAIKKALSLLGPSFFVLYGDSFLPIKYLPIEDAFNRVNISCLMTVMRNYNQWDKSNVIFEKDNLILYNKKDHTSRMHHIDYGLVILKAPVFDIYPAGKPFDLSEVYNQLSIKQDIYGYEVFERFYEIGSPKGIRDMESFLQDFEGNKL